MSKTRMNWGKLLSIRRLSGDGNFRPVKKRNTDKRSTFQKDFDRIIYSEPFRRLQNKTQVHTLPNNDHVRNRLTHSLEASTIARSIGLRVGKFIEDLGEPVDEKFTTMLAECAQAATVAHDIGNPPFGHAGEEAIQDWFRSTKSKKNAMDILKLSEEDWNDFCCFDGNAQGFRILAHNPQGFKDGGLELTCAVMAAFVKYPRLSTTPPGQKLHKKPGIFLSEASYFATVADEVALLQQPGSGNTQWARHPLAFVVEAADDIAYTTADIEDGVELGLIDPRVAIDLFAQALGEGDDSKQARDELGSHWTSLSRYRSKAIGIFIKHAATAFEEHYEGIMHGEPQDSLMKSTAKPVRTVFDTLKETANDRVFTSDRKLKIEMAGQEALKGILEVIALRLCDLVGAGSDIAALEDKNRAAWRAFKLLERQFAGGNRHSIFEQTIINNTDHSLKVRLILDFVSGMTDRYAYDLWQVLRGTKLA
jgi:dGTPase